MSRWFWSSTKCSWLRNGQRGIHDEMECSKVACKSTFALPYKKNGVGATLKINSHHKPSGMLRYKMKPQFFHFKYSCSLDLKCPPRNSSWYFISYLLISVINKSNLPKSFLSIWLYTLKNSLVIRCQEIMLFESKCNIFESKNHQRK